MSRMPTNGPIHNKDALTNERAPVPAPAAHAVSPGGKPEIPHAPPPTPVIDRGTPACCLRLPPSESPR
jgi:hypothetical protein